MDAKPKATVKTEPPAVHPTAPAPGSSSFCPNRRLGSAQRRAQRTSPDSHDRVEAPIEALARSGYRKPYVEDADTTADNSRSGMNNQSPLIVNSKRSNGIVTSVRSSSQSSSSKSCLKRMAESSPCTPSIRMSNDENPESTGTHPSSKKSVKFTSKVKVRHTIPGQCSADSLRAEFDEADISPADDSAPTKAGVFGDNPPPSVAHRHSTFQNAMNEGGFEKLEPSYVGPSYPGHSQNHVYGSEGTVPQLTPARHLFGTRSIFADPWKPSERSAGATSNATSAVSGGTPGDQYQQPPTFSHGHLPGLGRGMMSDHYEQPAPFNQGHPPGLGDGFTSSQYRQPTPFAQDLSGLGVGTTSSQYRQPSPFAQDRLSGLGVGITSDPYRQGHPGESILRDQYRHSSPFTQGHLSGSGESSRDFYGNLGFDESRYTVEAFPSAFGSMSAGAESMRFNEPGSHPYMSSTAGRADASENARNH